MDLKVKLKRKLKVRFQIGVEFDYRRRKDPPELNNTEAAKYIHNAIRRQISSSHDVGSEGGLIVWVLIVLWTRGWEVSTGSI